MTKSAFITVIFLIFLSNCCYSFIEVTTSTKWVNVKYLACLQESFLPSKCDNSAEVLLYEIPKSGSKELEVYSSMGEKWELQAIWLDSFHFQIISETAEITNSFSLSGDTLYSTDKEGKTEQFIHIKQLDHKVYSSNALGAFNLIWLDKLIPAGNSKLKDLISGAFGTFVYNWDVGHENILRADGVTRIIDFENGSILVYKVKLPKNKTEPAKYKKKLIETIPVSKIVWTGNS